MHYLEVWDDAAVNQLPISVNETIVLVAWFNAGKMLSYNIVFHCNHYHMANFMFIVQCANHLEAHLVFAISSRLLVTFHWEK